MVQLSFIPLRTGLRRAGGLLTEETSNGISFGRFSHGLHRVELCSIPRALDLAAAQWVRVRLAVCARLRLHCEGLSPSTPCWSPGALWLRFAKSHYRLPKGHRIFMYLFLLADK